MNHQRISDTLSTLTKLNHNIEQKKEDRENAKEFNKKTVLGNPHNLSKLTEELQELELLFNRTKREL